MKNIFIVDRDDNLLESMQNITFVDKVDFRSYRSVRKFTDTLDETVVDLVFLSLSASDADEFIIYDLLKKCRDSSSDIPVFFTYNDGNTLKDYRSLKYQPIDYLKEPVSTDSIRDLVLRYLSVKSADEDSASSNSDAVSDTFEKETDTLFDDLMRRDKDENGEGSGDNQGIFTVHDEQIDQVKEEFAKIKSSNRDLIQENRNLMNRLSDLEEEKKKADSSERVEELKKSLAEKASQIKELKSIEESQRSFIGSKNREIDRLTGQLEQHQRELQALKKKLAEKESEIRNLQESLKKFKEISQKLKEIE